MIALALLPDTSAAQTTSPPEPPGQEVDPSNVETPAFPRTRYLDAFRFRFGSGFNPGGEIPGAEFDRYSPNIRLRLTIPLAERAVAQLTGRFESSQYDLTRVDQTGSRVLGPPDSFHAAQLRLQGAYGFARRTSWLFEEESWSVLGSIDVNARWQGNAFGDSLEPSLSLGVGYDTLPLRIALGVRVAGRLGRGGVSVSPIIDLRYRFGDRWTVRNRGLGGQVELDVLPNLMLFATAYESGSRYLLSEQSSNDGSLTFSDDQLRAGAGFEWKIARYLRLNLEAGAIVDRELEIDRVRGPTLFKANADTPGAYVAIRFEVRP